MTTIALDFDGTIHAYTSGWTGVDPTDDPIPGARDFVRKLVDDGHTVVIFSTRAETPEGRVAIQAWLVKHDFPVLGVTSEKDVRFEVFIDDRAVPFRGDFDRTRADVDDLIAHPKWWTLRAERGETDAANMA